MRQGSGAAAPARAVSRHDASPPPPGRDPPLPVPPGSRTVPFFAALARGLAASGAEVWRVGFNAGDRLFWRDRTRFIAYEGRLEDWEEAVAAILDARGITDLVLYGEARPVHAAALRVARARGLRLHILEEGYMRPWWSTYERGGTNGNSPMMELTLAQMRETLRHPAPDPPAPADRWGDLRAHMFWGALYHGAVLLGPRPSVPSHREVPVAREFRLHLARLLKLPLQAAARHRATRLLLRRGLPYHLALLQLEHDPTYRHGSPFASMTDFAEVVLDGFAKARRRITTSSSRRIRSRTAALRSPRDPPARRGGGDRGQGAFHSRRQARPAHGHARSAVTVSSTAAQQALWRGIPVKCLGRAVYAKPELVSGQPLAEFFAAPDRPDPAAYRDFRRFLAETSQVSGGFYSARGRRRLLLRLVDLMLDPDDPYARRCRSDAATVQHLKPVA
jgi:capsular polysaccharide export protein